MHTLVNLLSATDSHKFFGALLPLTSSAECPECREMINEIVENLLVILHEHDFLSSMFVKILRLVWKFGSGVESSSSFICYRRKAHLTLISNSSAGSLSSANAAETIQYHHLLDELSPDGIQENTFSLKAACCAAVTELVLSETTAFQTVQSLEICLSITLVLLFLYHFTHRDIDTKVINIVLCFQSPEISLQYGKNQHIFESYDYEDILKQITESIENMNKASTKHVGNNAILEHIGSGAPGSVYKVRKHNRQNLLTIKEVNLAFGKEKKKKAGVSHEL
ncbi:Serine/threonine-protein kinase Nek10 [Lonchura striata]|uniref:Serine/threonine-protein kinase Nek10 n=1 Tax=Lonchura striata TaxID=40157 RepID=A0A218UJS9_9PASE|nr:Serine/threonine-protein kinase Nek10 [Lonchura striata domestica]